MASRDEAIVLDGAEADPNNEPHSMDLGDVQGVGSLQRQRLRVLANDVRFARRIQRRERNPGSTSSSEEEADDIGPTQGVPVAASALPVPSVFPSTVLSLSAALPGGVTSCAKYKASGVVSSASLPSVFSADSRAICYRDRFSNKHPRGTTNRVSMLKADVKHGPPSAQVSDICDNRERRHCRQLKGVILEVLNMLETIFSTICWKEGSAPGNRSSFVTADMGGRFQQQCVQVSAVETAIKVLGNMIHSRLHLFRCQYGVTMVALKDTSLLLGERLPQDQYPFTLKMHFDLEYQANCLICATLELAGDCLNRIRAIFHCVWDQVTCETRNRSWTHPEKGAVVRTDDIAPIQVMASLALVDLWSDMRVRSEDVSLFAGSQFAGSLSHR